MKVKTIMEGIAAGIGAAVGFFIGPINGLLIGLLCFMAIDIITGIINACIHKKLSSKISFTGLAKKVFIILMVGLANVIDTMIFAESAALRTAVIFFYIANEGISVLENISASGLPIPSKIIDALHEIKGKGEDENGNDETDRD